MNKVTVAPFKFIGISARTTNENRQGVKDISELWNAFISKGILEKIPNKVDYTIYSIYTEYEKDHTKPYTTILGCKVENLDNIPIGMIGRLFEGGEYIKISARGDLTKGLIGNEWMRIWEMDLDRAYTVDLEVYGEKSK